MYHLVTNLDGKSAGIHEIKTTTVGNNLHLFPEADLAFLIADDKRDQPYAVIDYGDVREGADIAVGGYPLPNLVVDKGMLRYDGLIYRVSRGVVTARYDAPIQGNQIQSPTVVPWVEVNFLFVSGNSGGPIFRPETGVVVGFVHGFNAHKIVERVSTANIIQQLPPGMSPQYIEHLSAIYSLGIKMDCAKTHLQKFGVSV